MAELTPEDRARIAKAAKDAYARAEADTQVAEVRAEQIRRETDQQET